MPPREPTVCVKALRGLVFAGTVATGKSLPEVASAIGVAPALLADMTLRVPHSVALRAWETMTRLSGDESFGLLAAQLLDGAPLDLVDYALTHSHDGRDLLDRFVRYQSLFHEANDVRHEPRGEHAYAVIHRFRGDLPSARALDEFILGTWVIRARRWMSAPIDPLDVSLPWPPPADDTRHRRVFGVRPRFNAPQKEVVWPAHARQARSSGSDPALRDVLASQVERELAARGATEAMLLDRARGVARTALLEGRGELDIDEVAKLLATSARTLQRRLREGGTSYRELVDDVRRELALEHVQRGDATVTDLAFLLGFSDLSAFSRAFRRWTGQSPAQYRGATISA